MVVFTMTYFGWHILVVTVGQSACADVSDREKNFAGMFMSALLLFLSLSSESTIRISPKKTCAKRNDREESVPYLRLNLRACTAKLSQKPSTANLDAA